MLVWFYNFMSTYMHTTVSLSMYSTCNTSSLLSYSEQDIWAFSFLLFIIQCRPHTDLKCVNSFRLHLAVTKVKIGFRPSGNTCSESPSAKYIHTHTVHVCNCTVCIRPSIVPRSTFKPSVIKCHISYYIYICVQYLHVQYFELSSEMYRYSTQVSS